MPVVRKQRELGLRGISRTVPPASGLPLLLFAEGEVRSLGRVRLCVTPWTGASQTPPSMGFSRQEYWSGLPFPSPGELHDPGIEPGSQRPAWVSDCRQPLYCLSPPGSPWFGEGRPLLNAWAVPHSFSPSKLHSDIPCSSFQTTQHSGASPSFLGLGRKDIDHGQSLAGLSCASVAFAALVVKNLPASAAAARGGVQSLG